MLKNGYAQDCGGYAQGCRGYAQDCGGYAQDCKIKSKVVEEMYFLKCIFLKCSYPKCIFAKYTRLACLLSFASLFLQGLPLHSLCSE